LFLKLILNQFFLSNFIPVELNLLTGAVAISIYY